MYFPDTAQAEMAPPTSPMASAPRGVTNPHAGVIATAPATAPEATPKVVAFPWRIFS